MIGDETLGRVRLSTSFRRPTISAMGLPGVGLEGCRLKSYGSEGQDSEPIRSVENNR